MKPDTVKQLIALHAQASAMVQQIEALIDMEEAGECQHENAEDQSRMGMKPRQVMYCPDCNQTFDGSEE
jgi:hypothetical protein